MMGTVNFTRIVLVSLLAAAQLAGSGSITGTIRLPSGAPASGVRVMAMIAPSGGRGLGQSSVLASLTETDAQGRFRLEDIPPGRYLVAAGPVATPTFYPGTTFDNQARVITVTQESSAFSGIDFEVTLNTARGTPTMPAVPPDRPCCSLSGLLITEDGTPLPAVPLRMIETVSNRSVALDDGFFRIVVERGATAQFVVEGLPPGYSVKSVVYGGRNAGPSVLIDGRQPQSLLFTIAGQPTAQPALPLPRVTVRGSIVNMARELRAEGLSLALTPTLSGGTPVVFPIQPDLTFEVRDILAGAYRVGVQGAGNAAPWLVQEAMVIRPDTPEVKIDLADNPFPDAAVVASVFSDGPEITITGIATQRITRPRTGFAYFRMEVRDGAGAATSWAIYAPNPGLIPNIAVGQSYTVMGAVARDGSKRLRAQPF